MALLPDEIINQRYRIVTLLGEGDYGAVYRVWDKAAQQDFALKEYLNTSPEVQKAFRSEVKRLTRLSHPQLPTIRDHFSLNDVGQYLVSDYIDGVDLQTLLNQYGPLPTSQIITWLQSVCDPLSYLHDKNQLHLNLKPANIRLTPAGDVFLVDTGLPGLGIMPRQDGYAAPEQQKQQAVTAASDIYSLGATLYALLTAAAPPEAMRRESGLVTLTSAREVNPNSEPYLSLVANRAMSMRPDARYETAADFARALERPSGHPTKVLSEQPRRVTTRTASAAPPPQPPVSRRRKIEGRTIWALTAVLVMLVLTTVTLLLVQQEELVGGSPDAATATIESQVIAALTAVAPTATNTPLPTLVPTPTPAPIISQTGMHMLYVPGGIFRFGNNEGDPDESPSQLVNMDPFFIDETEVTNGQYEQCVADSACNPPTRLTASYHPAYYGTAEYEDYPVVFVDWFAADNFCQWRGARLPTEAEWERAAGFDPVSLQRTLYPWGDEFDGTLLNFCDANCPRDGRAVNVDDGHTDTSPVASFDAGRSHIGAADMLGNVMEWVNDWYDRDYYSQAPNINPRGPAEGEFKSLRGGSWFSHEDELRVTQRGFFDPTVARATLGFRCAMDLP